MHIGGLCVVRTYANMKIYSVFVRYNTDNVRSHGGYYSDSANIDVEEYAGSYDSRAAALAAARNVDISVYNTAHKNWEASVRDAWTTFAFVFGSDLNSPANGGAVSDAADEVASAARKEWRRSPAGLASAERQKQLTAAYKIRNAKDASGNVKFPATKVQR